jgi:hypothetical protein
MAHRSFIDSLGRHWDVWSVVPIGAERRRRDSGPMRLDHERRSRREERDMIDDRWANGWLTFETRGEKRRLAKYPEDWADLNPEQLEWLCDGALVIPRSNRLLR